MFTGRFQTSSRVTCTTETVSFLIESRVSCPYCGETQLIFIDPSLQQQQYTEDCQVCCQPMIVRVRLENDDTAIVSALREDDA